ADRPAGEPPGLPVLHVVAAVLALIDQERHQLRDRLVHGDPKPVVPADRDELVLLALRPPVAPAPGAGTRAVDARRVGVVGELRGHYGSSPSVVGSSRSRSSGGSTCRSGSNGSRSHGPVSTRSRGRSLEGSVG